MGRTAPTVLKYIAESYATQPEMYEQILMTYIEQNIAEDGSIIDQQEQRQINDALRCTLVSMGTVVLSEVMAMLDEYEGFGGSEILMSLLSLTRRFVIAVSAKPNHRVAYYNIWRVKMDRAELISRVERLTLSLIADRVEKYMDNLMSTNR